jgi:hypothetical protein
MMGQSVLLQTQGTSTAIPLSHLLLVGYESAIPVRLSSSKTLVVWEAVMVGNRGLASLVMGVTAGVALAISGFMAAGCSSKAAANTEQKTTAMLAGMPQRPLERRAVAKPAPRESAVSTYTNVDYGVTFRYPRNWALDEGPLDEDTTDRVSGVRSQEELESEQAGGVLAATIVVPDDAFPNTTFAGGSVQFAMNRYLAGEGCRNFPGARLGDSNGATGTKMIQGVVFAWADSNAGEGDKEFFERDYAGFSEGTCYEFFLRVGVEAAGNFDQAKPVNQKKIVGQLEKVVESLQMTGKEVSVLDRKASEPVQRRH